MGRDRMSVWRVLDVEETLCAVGRAVRHPQLDAALPIVRSKEESSVELAFVGWERACWAGPDISDELHARQVGLPQLRTVRAVVRVEEPSA